MRAKVDGSDSSEKSHYAERTFELLRTFLPEKESAAVISTIERDQVQTRSTWAHLSYLIDPFQRIPSRNSQDSPAENARNPSALPTRQPIVINANDAFDKNPRECVSDLDEGKRSLSSPTSSGWEQTL